MKLLLYIFRYINISIILKFYLESLKCKLINLFCTATILIYYDSKIFFHQRFAKVVLELLIEGYGF